jgi:hypothetical protein
MKKRVDGMATISSVAGIWFASTESRKVLRWSSYVMVSRGFHVVGLFFAVDTIEFGHAWREWVFHVPPRFRSQNQKRSTPKQHIKHRPPYHHAIPNKPPQPSQLPSIYRTLQDVSSQQSNPEE